MTNYISTIWLNINNHVLSIREAFAHGYFPSCGDEFAPIHLHSLTQFSLSPTAHICQPAGWGEGHILCHITKTSLLACMRMKPMTSTSLTIWGTKGANWSLTTICIHFVRLEMLASNFKFHEIQHYHHYNETTIKLKGKVNFKKTLNT